MRPVRFECRKWPDSPHWEFDAERIGADTHGIWCGVRAGTVMQRPGITLTAAADHVVLVPHEDWFLATFYGSDPVRPFDIYVDITTPSYWIDLESTLRTVDLDLDVIRGTTGRIWVDDEDEFAEHRKTLGYPTDVVEHALESCTSIEAMIVDAEPPFDALTAAEWLARFRRKVSEQPGGR